MNWMRRSGESSRGYFFIGSQMVMGTLPLSVLKPSTSMRKSRTDMRIAFAKAYTDYLANLENLSLAQVLRQAEGQPPHVTAAANAL